MTAWPRQSDVCPPMSEVFISYKREDEARVAILVAALEGAGLDVWWDQKIAAADRWRDRILEQLEAAKCVLVVWSAASTGPDGGFVVDEANRALKRGMLLQVRIDPVEIPLGFGEYQALDLIIWKGDPADSRFQNVAAAARAMLEGRRIPAPKGQLRRRTALWAGSGSVLVAALLSLGVPALRGIACGLPGVRGLCGELGIGGVPSRAEEALWTSRRPGDCDALRSFLFRFPNGAHSAEAQARLLAARSETTETWTQEERRPPLVVRGSLSPFPSEQAARNDALARAPEEAQGACGTYNEGEYRLRSARAVPKKWQCSQRLGGFGCGFDGEAVCAVNVRSPVTVTTCP